MNAVKVRILLVGVSFRKLIQERDLLSAVNIRKLSTTSVASFHWGKAYE